MLGVAVLIIVISVMSGFDQEWRNRILGFNAHLKITGTSKLLDDYPAVIEKIKMNPEVKGVAPFVRGQVLLGTQPQEGNPKYMAPMLLGIDPDLQATVSVLPTSIKAGKFDLDGNNLVIGRDFAESMDLVVGDRVLLYSPGTIEKMVRTIEEAQKKTRPIEEATLPPEYTISGIFDVGYGDYNATIVASSLPNSQELYNLGDGVVHGLQIMLNDPFQAEKVRLELVGRLGPGFNLITWAEESPHIFNALAVEKNMMFYLLFFIMIVAGFGIVNCQITFVVQKTREIGILKALGADNLQVLLIFLSQSLVVGVLGVGLGLASGLLALHYRNDFLRLMNKLFGFELLPAQIYQIYELPVSIEAWDIFLICSTAFFICLMAGVFPAWKASRLQPVEALRHE